MAESLDVVEANGVSATGSLHFGDGLYLRSRAAKMQRRALSVLVPDREFLALAREHSDEGLAHLLGVSGATIWGRRYRLGGAR